jgi:uncharacterized membrane protein
METRASFAEHPIHPILVTFPIGMWTFSLVCDVLYRLRDNPFWSDVAFYTMVGGLIGALVAAVPGLLDYLTIRDKSTKRVGTAHLVINLTIVALYAVNLWLRMRSLPESVTPMVMSVVAFALLLVSGWLGGEMVFRHGVGTAPSYEIEVARRRQQGAA